MLENSEAPVTWSVTPGLREGFGVGVGTGTRESSRRSAYTTMLLAIIALAPLVFCPYSYHDMMVGAKKGLSVFLKPLSFKPILVHGEEEKQKGQLCSNTGLYEYCVLNASGKPDYERVFTPARSAATPRQKKLAAGQPALTYAKAQLFRADIGHYGPYYGRVEQSRGSSQSTLYAGWKMEGGRREIEDTVISSCIRIEASRYFKVEDLATTPPRDPPFPSSPL
ncbi:hypothetical protein JHW43_008273 [Diplocarpon mali]|nr:hypothetical protein JHW43_008273 [Diplocarpon mali]